MATFCKVDPPRRAGCSYGPRAELAQKNRTVELGKACLTRDWSPNDFFPFFETQPGLDHDRFLGFGNLALCTVISRAGPRSQIARLDAADEDREASSEIQEVQSQ